MTVLLARICPLARRYSMLINATQASNALKEFLVTAYADLH
jgi:hypothetical protein